MKLKTMALVGMAAMTAASCSTTKKAETGKSESMRIEKTDKYLGYIDVDNEQRMMVERNNGFALDLFENVTGKASKVVSPLSVTYLMSVLANGADGQTRREIVNALGWQGLTLEQINTLCRQLTEGAATVDKATTLNIANYVAISKNEKLKPAFQTTVKDMYGGMVEKLDFTSPKAVSRINSWCSDHTGGMIPRLLDSLDPSTVACAVNAIYFNGTWKDKFKTTDTKDEQFFGYTRDIKMVKMMHRNGSYRYFDNDVLSAVAMPYGNGGYEMTVILPAQGKSVKDVIETLKAKGMKTVWQGMEECEVDLKLPRFTTETEHPLNEVIKKLGAPSMFDSNADFSNLTSGAVYVSKMLQKAKIEVSEEGTKAAAATAAVMMRASLMPAEKRKVEFHANRPFVYMITERASGAIFFIGQYAG